MSKKAKPRALKHNEALAVARLLRGSARKLNLVAATIRGKKAARALTELEFSPRKAAKDVRKVLQAAVANAENNHSLDVDQLVVAEATVGKALVLKRIHTRARGRAASIKKPFSRLRIVVREEPRAEEKA